MLQERDSRFFPLAAGCWAKLCLVLIWLAWLPCAQASRTPSPQLSPEQLASLTSPQETRVGVCVAIPSGRLFSEGFLKLAIAPAYDELAYEIVSGRRQWLNRDPIGIEGGVNLYAYVRNQSSYKIDAFGLAQSDIPAGLAGKLQPDPGLDFAVHWDDKHEAKDPEAQGATYLSLTVVDVNGNIAPSASVKIWWAASEFDPTGEDAKADELNHLRDARTIARQFLEASKAILPELKSESPRGGCFLGYELAIQSLYSAKYLMVTVPEVHAQRAKSADDRREYNRLRKIALANRKAIAAGFSFSRAILVSCLAGE